MTSLLGTKKIAAIHFFLPATSVNFFYLINVSKTWGILYNRNHRLEKWMKNWQLEFAAHTCYFMAFRFHKKIVPNLKVYGVPIEQRQEIKFLGLRFGPLLNFERHIKHLKKSCDERLNIQKFYRTNHGNFQKKS